MENLTVVIPFRNGHATMRRLLDSLPEEVPVVVVDDLSDEPFTWTDWLRPNIRILRLDDRGYFSGAVNAGVDACGTDVLVLNQDAWLEGDAWLDLLAESRGDYAMVGEGISGGHPAWPKGYVHGTFMFLRRDAWDEVGGLNERDYPLWGSTCEWQLRACRKGYRALPLPVVPGFHHARAGTFGSAITETLEREPGKRDLLVRTPPAVSVVINAYNYARFLPDAVNSLLGGPTCLGDMPGQTFQSFEVIIVDDGSTDETPEVCRELADDWKAVRYVQRENGGTAAANNTGIERSHGRYVSILCADDLMAAERLENLYRACERNPGRFAFDDVAAFGEGVKDRKHWGPLKKLPEYDRPVLLWQMKEYDCWATLRKNRIHAGIMFAKADWRKAGCYPEAMRWGREDWAFNVALGAAGVCGLRVPGHTYLYRHEGQNRTLWNSTREWMAQFQRQMRALYPRLYSGEFMVSGCCPGRGNPNPRRGATMAKGRQRKLIGSEGMTLLEYQGGNVGGMTFYAESGNRYVFSAEEMRRRGYVAKEDVDWFLRVRIGRKAQFEVVKEPRPVKARPKPVDEEPPDLRTPPDLRAVEATPAAAKWAVEHDINLAAVEGTGKGGRVTLKDAKRA